MFSYAEKRDFLVITKTSCWTVILVRVRVDSLASHHLQVKNKNMKWKLLLFIAGPSLIKTFLNLRAKMRKLKLKMIHSHRQTSSVCVCCNYRKFEWDWLLTIRWSSSPFISLRAVTCTLLPTLSARLTWLGTCGGFSSQWLFSLSPLSLSNQLQFSSFHISRPILKYDTQRTHSHVMNIPQLQISNFSSATNLNSHS